MAIEDETGEIVEHRLPGFSGKLLGSAVEVSQPLQHERDAGCPSLGLLMQRLEQPIVGDTSSCRDGTHFIQGELKLVPSDIDHGSASGQLNKARRCFAPAYPDYRMTRRYLRNGLTHDFVH